MCLVLRKCYNQKILSNHPLKICPFSNILDRKLKFRYSKPQVAIWKCKLSIEEILFLLKFFLKLIDFFRDSILQVLNVIAAQQTRNLVVAVFFKQGIMLRILTSRGVSLEHFLCTLLLPLKALSFGLFMSCLLD